MVELYVASVYMRLYRDHVYKRVKWTRAIKAIASSGSIAAWAIWKEYGMIWGFIIACSQLADALKDVFPFVKTHKTLSEHTITLNSIFIDTQLEWERVFGGQYSDDETMKSRHKLAKLQHDVEKKDFPEGLEKNDTLFSAAQQEASIYFTNFYDQAGTES